MVLRLLRKLFGVYKLPKNCRIGYGCSISNGVIMATNSGGSITIGDGTEVLKGVVIMTYGGMISIGRWCSINPYAVIYGHGGVCIGDNVLIAAHCVIIPSNHKYSDPNKLIRLQGESKKGIIIEDDVWLGAGSVILDGVKIGRGSVVAAGSVVRMDVPPYSVVAGVPAKVIKSRA